ncbi:MAG: hypothetical protein JNL43_04720 [Flavobacteriales bacterium]|nr:hypothetical protein [Flavobacteriales bacterium]
MTRFVALGLGVLLSTSTKAQDEARYADLVKHAYVLYEQKDFKGSAETYSKAFEALGWKGTSNDRYNAACSWALAGIVDSAYFHLFRIAERMNYANIRHLQSDTDLNTLHTDARWPSLCKLVQANKDKMEVNLDRPLSRQLDSILDLDQRYREQIDGVEQAHGRQSKEMMELWHTMAATDSTNLIFVSKVLDQRGWLGPDIVGESGNSALFLVVQHADLATQEKYLPMMRDAVRKGNAKGSSLALLEDRVLMRNGKRQLYGSQIGRDPETGVHYLVPLEDPDHVDERRASVGLGTLAEYLAYWDMTWDAEAYKRELPALEERIKAQRK